MGEILKKREKGNVCNVLELDKGVIYDKRDGDWIVGMGMWESWGGEERLREGRGEWERVGKV